MYLESCDKDGFTWEWNLNSFPVIQKGERGKEGGREEEIRGGNIHKQRLIEEEEEKEMKRNQMKSRRGKKRENETRRKKEKTRGKERDKDVKRRKRRGEKERNISK